MLVRNRPLVPLTAEEVTQALAECTTASPQTRTSSVRRKAITSTERAEKNKNRWTEAENQKLLNLCSASGIVTKEIARQMGRHLRACKGRFRLLRSEHEWTFQQVSDLVQMVKNRENSGELWKEVSLKVKKCDRYCSSKALRLGLEVSFGDWSQKALSLCKNFDQRPLVNGRRDWDSPLAKKLLELHTKSAILSRLQWLEKERVSGLTPTIF